MEGSLAVPPSPTEKPKAPGTAKRKKVNHACVYCRRSHMTCDSERPCTRCVKRNIGHLCHDEIKEAKTKSPKRDATSSPSAMASTAAAVKTEPDGQSTVIDSQMMRPPAGPAVYANNMQVQSNNKSSGQATTSQQTTQRTAEGQNAAPTTGLQNGGIGDELSTFYDSSLFGLPPDTYSQFASEHTNSEFLVLSDFLSIMGDPNGTFPNSPNPNAGSLYPANGYAFSDFKEDNLTAEQQKALQATSAQYTLNGSLPQSRAPSNAPSRVASRRASFSNVAKSTTSADSSTAQEKFFLTAADPNPESPEDRLKQVINAKVEAGLMKPFNYVRGYARLQKYMDQNMSADSRSRILAPLSTFRPAFRGIAKRLTDVDLILVEEAFERLLLDYDRVFTSMAVPACLWRRTGEIFRGNKEFAALLNLPVGSLRDGKLAITELMAEDSAVNYWEKYGDIAFDGQQKAVLTSCLLQVPGDQKGAVVSCCFSFTIKRDRYNIPSCIVGNFIPITL